MWQYFHTELDWAENNFLLPSRSRCCHLQCTRRCHHLQASALQGSTKLLFKDFFFNVFMHECVLQAACMHSSSSKCHCRNCIRVCAESRPAVEQFTQRIFGIPSGPFFDRHLDVLSALRGLLTPARLPAHLQSLLIHMRKHLQHHAGLLEQTKTGKVSLSSFAAAVLQ